MAPNPKQYSAEEIEDLKATLTEEEFAGMFDEDMVDDPEDGAEYDEGELDGDGDDGTAEDSLFADQKDIAEGEGDEEGSGDDAGDEGDDGQADAGDDDDGEADAGKADPDDGDDAGDDAGAGDEAAAAADDELVDIDLPEPPTFAVREPSAELKARADALERELNDLAEKHDEGEITTAEFTKESRRLNRELAPIDVKLATETVTAEDAHAQAVEHWGNTTVPAFIEAFPEYKSPRMLKILDDVVREVQVEEATANPLHPDVLRKAHRIIEKEYGFKFARTAKAAADPAVDAGKANADTKPAEPAKKGVKPASERQLPPTLGRVPAAAHEETVDNSRWAAIDRLTGVAYEEALQRLPEAEREAYLQST